MSDILHDLKSWRDGAVAHFAYYDARILDEAYSEIKRLRAELDTLRKLQADNHWNTGEER